MGARKPDHLCNRCSGGWGPNSTPSSTSRSRRFGLKRFGVLFGAILTVSTMGTGLGPVVAGAIFDKVESYDPFLLAIIPITLVGAVAMACSAPTRCFRRRRSRRPSCRKGDEVTLPTPR
ncbi:hypothetical protein BREVUG8_70214 [Brevundimonas sp. G8]|nr:hypothetical protein BREVUG8_70214 [Brevundimonas sp. G8]